MKGFIIVLSTMAALVFWTEFPSPGLAISASLAFTTLLLLGFEE